jgi:8-oxo-dGTP pyrophosphatase MutT (NUDIX family)
MTSLVIKATLCHVIKGDKLLLKKATRGISIGKWNAPGGKIERGESPEECAKREVLEETGLRVSELFDHGTLSFVMDGGKNYYMDAQVFSTRKAEGRARSSPEGPVRWYPLNRLPHDEMWEDDLYWLPLMLRGVRFDAKFVYDKANRHVTDFEISSR